MSMETPRYDAVEAITSRHEPRDWFHPGVYRTAYIQADREDRDRLRRHLSEIDSGRFWDWLDETQRLISRSDRRRRNHARNVFSDWTLQWVATWAIIEDLDPVPNVTGVSAPSSD